MHVLLERLLQRPPESVSDEELLATIRLLEDGDRKYSIIKDAPAPTSRSSPSSTGR